MTRAHYPRALVTLQPTLQTLVAGGTKQISRVNIIPESCTFVSNDIAQADTAEIRIPWRNFPLHPSLLTDCRIVLYLADVEDPRVDLDFTNQRYVCFVGFVDEHEVEGSSAGGWVKMRARDYSGPLMDVRWNGASIRSDVPLSQSIRQVLKPITNYSTLDIEVERDGAIKGFTGLDTWVPPRTANVWEVITGLAQATGQVADWRLGTLVVKAPAQVTAKDARLLAFGNKLESFNIRKTANPLYNKQIKFRNLNTKTGTIVEGMWPATVDGSREQIVIPLSSELNPQQLQDLAKNIFVTYARRHIAGSFETIAMSDDQGKLLVGADDTDSQESATLKSGDAVYIDLRLAQRGLMFGQTTQDMQAFLRDGGMPRQEAESVVASWMKGNEAATLFSVRRATHRLSEKGGYTLNVDFENVVGGD